MNGDGKPEWFADADSDGQNDLIIALGTLPAPAADGRHGSATAVNDLGLVVGASSHYNFETRIGSQEPFIVVPKDTDGDGRADCWYEDSDGDGFNDLMIALGRLAGVPVSFNPVELNLNERWPSDRVVRRSQWSRSVRLPSDPGRIRTATASPTFGIARIPPAASTR